MNGFRLNSEIYYVGDAVIVKRRCGEQFAARVTWIRGCDIFMRTIDESELQPGYKIFNVSN